MSFIRATVVAAFAALAVPTVLLAQGGREGGRGGGGQPLKNLQVLPKDMTRQQVTALMRTFTSALGVRCDHCHEPDPNAAPPAEGRGRGGPELDHSLDGKETKKVAREMIRMVNAINSEYLPKTGRTIDARNQVSCETCHHGLSRPQTLRAALAGAVQAKDGYYRILGRIDDVINVAGHRLGTKEIESAALTVAEVAEAAVVPVIDQIKGKVPDLYVSLKPGLQPSKEIADRVSGAVVSEIGPIARPKYLLFTPDLPKTRSGKIMRRLLRDVAEGRSLGDTTTLADAGVVETIRAGAASGSSDEE